MAFIEDPILRYRKRYLYLAIYIQIAFVASADTLLGKKFD